LSDIAEALAALKAKFLARATNDLAELRSWSARGAPAEPEMRQRVHRLAGAAGTFGFHDLSDLAKRVDDRLASGEAGDAPALIAELRRVLGG
jgi:HPt (histidine-containing phosphotransfer) domain-containing protein